MHDRARIHDKTCIVVGRNKTIRVRMAPPRSPDLMPLDYAVFGCVKNALKRAGLRYEPWQVRAQKFEDLLGTFDASASIAGFKRRLQLCLAADGGHFSTRRTSPSAAI